MNVQENVEQRLQQLRGPRAFRPLHAYDDTVLEFRPDEEDMFKTLNSGRKLPVDAADVTRELTMVSLTASYNSPEDAQKVTEALVAAGLTITP